MDEGKESDLPGKHETEQKQDLEQQHLLKVHYLERVNLDVYITSETKKRLKQAALPKPIQTEQGAKEMTAAELARARRRENDAERQRRCRANRKEAGEVNLRVPKEVAQEIKEAGGFRSWYEKTKMHQVVVEREMVEMPLSERKKNFIEIGKRVSRLTGLRARVVWKLLGLRKVDP